MNKKNREKLVAAVLLVSGLGLCIAGIFVPPLLVLGGGLLAGAMAVIGNILQDKDRITVNNNYITPTPVHEKQKESSPVLPELQNKSPNQKLKSFFGFKNKKFMQHHNELERLLNKIPETPEPQEYESNSMQLPSDVLEELNKLNEVFNKIDMELIAKIAQQCNEKAYSGKSHSEGQSIR